MKKEKARLQQLRAMSHEEYLTTTEWQKTRKLALKRADGCCQECDAEGVNLEIYHLNGDNLGCEQESDVIALCEQCFNRINGSASPKVPNLSLKQRALICTPAAIVSMGLPALIHAPLPAEVGGLAAVIVLAIQCPKVYAAIKGGMPSWAVEFIDKRAEQLELRRQSGEWSILDRILGRHMRDYGDDISEEDLEAYMRANGYDEEIITACLGEQVDDPPPTENNPVVPVGRSAGNNPRMQLDLASNFLPDINLVLQEGILACGIKGSGKTGVIARIIEQIIKVSVKVSRRGPPMVIFDKEGDLQSLMDIFPNGRVVDQEHWYTAEQIITGRLQVIVNLHAWLKSEDKAARIAKLVNDLIEYTGKLPSEECIPCPVFLDEGQFWLPQGSVSYMSKDTQTALLDGFDVLLNAGRKRGLTPFIFTQRMAQINKDVCSTGIYIFMRQVLDNDQKRCMEYIRAGILPDKKEIATFEPGQGVVCLPKGVQLIVQFKERETVHLSHAPTVERIETNEVTQSVGVKTKVGDLSLDELVTLLNRTRPPDTEELANPDEPLPLGKEVSISREMFEVAVRMRKSGMSTGYRDLMTTFELSEHYAKSLNKLIETEIAER